MTQETTKEPAVTGANELDAEQAKSVGGGVDACISGDASTFITGITGQLTQAYEDLVDTASHIMERVITATKEF
jgi:hypothetical protein